MQDTHAPIADIEELGSSTIAELSARHKLSPTKLYDEIKAGRLRTFAIGAARRISAKAERDWIAQSERDASHFEPLKKTPKSKMTA